MAITPRTILTSAAPATVAVVSLYFFTVLGTAAFTCMTNSDDATDPVPDRSTYLNVSDTERSGPCTHVATQFGTQKSQWSEFAWSQYTQCYDQNQDSAGAINAADEGLKFHPRSEFLYNVKGYHLIRTGEHAEAIDTLREGMDRVVHNRNGIMANNLAWAGLWEPRQMRPDEARELYVQSLSQSTAVCETLHTGMFVEFSIAAKTQGLDRFDALKRFSQIRDRYTNCLDRIDDGDWDTVVEIVGAAVVFNNVDSADKTTVQPLLKRATAKMKRDFNHASAEDVCSEAMPMAEFHHECVDAVNLSLRQNRAEARNHRERNQRVQTNREILQQYGHDYPVIRSNCSQSRR